MMKRLPAGLLLNELYLNGAALRIVLLRSFTISPLAIIISSNYESIIKK